MLFVYGSLKRGERHHDELRSGGAKFLREATTEPGYALVPGPGDYFALVRTNQATQVPGELFEVDAALLQALDAFEGEEYCRALIRVTARVTAPETSETSGLSEALAYLQKAR